MCLGLAHLRGVAFWHPFWVLALVAIRPEVSAGAATSGYCLATLTGCKIRNRKQRWGLVTRAKLDRGVRMRPGARATLG